MLVPKTLAALLFLGWSASCPAQKPLKLKYTEAGVFSVGIRTGLAGAISEDGLYVSPGLGAQCRLMPVKRINTEWYFEFYHGGYGEEAVRTDGHLGCLVLLYPQRRLQRVAPFLALGPNADYLRIRDRLNKDHLDSRWAFGFQGGLGMHIHITRRSDLTLSTQYMVHAGQPVVLQFEDSVTVSVPQSGSGTDGQFLFNVSMNYKIADLWKRLRF